MKQTKKSLVENFRDVQNTKAGLYFFQFAMICILHNNSGWIFSYLVASLRNTQIKFQQSHDHCKYRYHFALVVFKQNMRVYIEFNDHQSK